MPKARPRHTIAIGWASELPGDRRLPRVRGMGCARYERGAELDHRNDHDQLCLVDEGDAVFTLGGEERPCPAGTLALIRTGERFAARPAGARATLLWSLYLHGDPVLPRECPALGERDPRRRVLRLDQRRLDEFHALYERLFVEQQAARPGAPAACSALLSLLLVAVGRWLGGEGDRELDAPATDDPEVLALWRLMSEHAGAPAELQAALRARVPNYDALRHRFRAAFGCSPRDALMRLRMDRAKRLLLDRSLSVAEVAARVGYARQHEFARAFHREVGCTPTWWRNRGGDPRKRR
jgi:AraC-like DNA-binding protein